MFTLPQNVLEMIQGIAQRYAPAQPADAMPMDLNSILAAAAGKSPVAAAASPDVRPDDGAGVAPPPPGAVPLGPIRDIPERRIAPTSEPIAEAPPPPAPRAAPMAPAPAAEPRDRSFLSQVGSVLRGLGSSNALLPAIGGAIGGVESDNATFRALTAKGLSDDTARAAMANPMFMASALSPKTQVINNRIVETSTGRVIADLSDTAVKGPDVHTFETPGGEKVSGVWSATRKRYELPDGRPIPSGETSVAGVPPGVDPKKFRTELAEKAAAARIALPGAIRASDEALKLIKEIEEDPNFDRVIGGLDGWAPTIREGSRNLEAKIAQLQGKTFLEAYNALKGAGAISDREGASAIAAFNRLAEKRVGEADYKAALGDARRELVQLRALAERKAAGDFSPMPSGVTPGGPPPPGAAASAPTRLPDGMAPEAAREEARRAIASGRDRGGVIEKLRAMGVSTEGL